MTTKNDGAPDAPNREVAEESSPRDQATTGAPGEPANASPLIPPSASFGFPDLSRRLMLLISFGLFAVLLIAVTATQMLDDSDGSVLLGSAVASHLRVAIQQRAQAERRLCVARALLEQETSRGSGSGALSPDDLHVLQRSVAERELNYATGKAAWDGWIAECVTMLVSNAETRTSGLAARLARAHGQPIVGTSEIERAAVEAATEALPATKEESRPTLLALAETLTDLCEFAPPNPTNSTTAFAEGAVVQAAFEELRKSGTVIHLQRQLMLAQLIASVRWHHATEVGPRQSVAVDGTLSVDRTRNANESAASPSGQRPLDEAMPIDGSKRELKFHRNGSPVSLMNDWAHMNEWINSTLRSVGSTPSKRGAADTSH